MYIPVHGFRLEEAVRRGKGLGFLEVEFPLLYENASRSGVSSKLIETESENTVEHSTFLTRSPLMLS